MAGWLFLMITRIFILIMMIFIMIIVIVIMIMIMIMIIIIIVIIIIITIVIILLFNDDFDGGDDEEVALHVTNGLLGATLHTDGPTSRPNAL